VFDLRADYGIEASRWEAHPGGFESTGWVVDAKWFIKVWAPDPDGADDGAYRQASPASGPELRLVLLEDLARAGLPVPAPLRNRRGALVTATAERRYAVFPFVAGRAANDDDWELTAAALRRVHAVPPPPLPRASMAEATIEALGERLDHPWIADRRRLLADYIERLWAVIDAARRTSVGEVLCHNDFGGWNLIIDGDRVAGIVDWDWAMLAPREHDLWIATEGPHARAFLEAYGAYDLDPTHLEYALLARALRDLAARVLGERDRPGVEEWGFRRLARLEDNLAVFAPFCRARPVVGVSGAGT